MSISNNDPARECFGGDPTREVVLPGMAQWLLGRVGKPVLGGNQAVESIPLIVDGNRVVFGVSQASTLPSVTPHQGGARRAGSGGFNQPAVSIATVAHDAAIARMVCDESVAFIVLGPLAGLVGLIDPGDSTEVVEAATKVRSIRQFDEGRTPVSEFDRPMWGWGHRLDSTGLACAQVPRWLAREVGQ